MKNAGACLSRCLCRNDSGKCLQEKSSAAIDGFDADSIMNHFSGNNGYRYVHVAI